MRAFVGAGARAGSTLAAARYAPAVDVILHAKTEKTVSFITYEIKEGTAIIRFKRQKESLAFNVPIDTLYGVESVIFSVL